MASEINLEQLINIEWLPLLKETIKKQPNAENYLSSKRRAMFPDLPNTFQALNLTTPQDCKIVIFGQDPYPRKESAIGIAFCDGLIKKWTDPTCPSLRNIFKGVLIHEGICTPTSKIADIRKGMATLKMISPYDWFFETGKQGVLWLNTSLTFTSNQELATHTAFWRPIVQRIVASLFEAKAALPSSRATDKALTFILWGGHAKKLRKMITAARDLVDKTLVLNVVESDHPAVESFHKVDTFSMVKEAQISAGQKPIQWIIRTEEAGKVDATKHLSSTIVPLCDAGKSSCTSTSGCKSTCNDEDVSEKRSKID